MQFPLRVPGSGRAQRARHTGAQGIGEFLVVSPGGGWKSKCWPAERYGSLCAELSRRHGLVRGGQSPDPSEAQIGAGSDPRGGAGENRGRFVCRCRNWPRCSRKRSLWSAPIPGPLHLAAALGTRNVALFGPTDPARNGPLPRGLVLRSESARGVAGRAGAYERGDEYSREMLALSVEQVLDGVERELSGKIMMPSRGCHDFRVRDATAGKDRTIAEPG